MHGGNTVLHSLQLVHQSLTVPRHVRFGQLCDLVVGSTGGC